MSNFDETTIKENSPEKLVKKLAISKAEDVFNRIQYKHEELIVIGGDTIVFFENRILGKPKDEKEAYNTLKSLQGNENYVYSGLAVIIKKDGKVIKKSDFTKSKVFMKPMTDEEILDYIKTKEPMDKAGSYAVQGIGSKFIEKIEGSYDSVVGLDIEKLRKMILGYVTIIRRR